MIDVDVIADTLGNLPTSLRRLLAPYDRDALAARPAPGEWCVLEVIGHVITCDDGAFRDRIAAIAKGAAVVPGFDAASALVALDPLSRDLDELLDELDAVRGRSVDFIRTLTPDELAASAPYRDHGTFAASDFLLEWPYHDLDHVGQIADALQRQYVPHMSATMRAALGASPAGHTSS